MDHLVHFQGPLNTLFLLERVQPRILDDNGGEALVAQADLMTFLHRFNSVDNFIQRSSNLSQPASGGGVLPLIPPLSSGSCLFIFEREHVLVLGEQGTEAWVPLEDARALTRYLAREGFSLC